MDDNQNINNTSDITDNTASCGGGKGCCHTGNTGPACPRGNVHCSAWLGAIPAAGSQSEVGEGQ